MKRHKWEVHSVTEINGAGVQVERWEECVRCGDTRSEFESPHRKFCPGAVAMPMPKNSYGEPYCPYHANNRPSPAPAQTAVGEGELPPLEEVECPHNPDVCECDLGMENECTITPSLKDWIAEHGILAQRERQLREAIAQRDDRDHHIDLAYSALGNVNRSVYLFDHISKLIAQRDETRKESAEILAAASQAQSDLGQDILDTEVTLAALTAGKP